MSKIIRQGMSIALLIPFFVIGAFAQNIPRDHYQDLSWRMIGPFRAGRTVGAVGVPSQPSVFYMGVNNGGVWKTDDYGRIWHPIFDRESTGSVGDIAVSPSNPNIVYVGTGEGLHRPDLAIGEGIFKSTDGGITWQHVGLKDVQQVGRLVVHPTNSDIVFVAGLGHPYGANEERGVFRTTDGGKTWTKVLYLNANTGAIQVELDPNNANTVYADLWEHREGPWENGSFSGPNSGLYKSTDGGSTWRKLTTGLPTGEQGLGRIGIAIAPGNSQRLYATVDARQLSGIYRSEDGGESWQRVSTDGRVFGRGSDFAELKVHPKNPDVVFSANVASYKSLDGGKTWFSFKGAPGGDDYHRIWINPVNPDIMIFAADQGAVVTVNAGKSWGTWYNQPTAQLYHVSTDNQFPYWVYGGQQESGAIGVASRGPGGQISFRDWMGVGADEYAYVVADPKDANIIYGGRLTRFDKRTGQSQNVAPEALRSGKYRLLRTLPVLFHPADNTMLLFATNVLWKSHTGGNSWEVISPDLSRPNPEVPASVGDFRKEPTIPQRGVIYSVAGSKFSKDVIWAGTDDGRVHVTTDGGKNWREVTPEELTSWDKISQIDAGQHDVNTAYISVNALRKDDLRPHIYKTTDGGRNWTRIVAGLPNEPVNVVREDPVQPGLLFAGTEKAVYFSADAGATWHPLRQNMPATSIRDLVIHERDLVVGTHGRSIWILDNFSPLRQLAQLNNREAKLFKPEKSVRVRFNMFSDTPLPPEEPAGQNPPDGAALDYYLPKAATRVQLGIRNAQGELVRSFSSADRSEQPDTAALAYPTYWFRQPESLSIKPGHHRFIWDLSYAPPRGAKRELSIAANYRNTATSPKGIFVPPGEYDVTLVVDGQSSMQKISVVMDPRVTASADDIGLQSSKSLQGYQLY
ncbi:MAG: WD40/YVTN/BNR-like repeat-containing protein, partial [Cyclobacteriaceae bacterium]